MVICVPQPFGDLLRQYRLAAGLSQEQLAHKTEVLAQRRGQHGITAKAISALERGERRFPHPQTVRLLADALGFSVPERASFIGPAGQLGTSVPALPPPPVPPTPLIGRGSELADAKRRLREEGVRLLTLTGPGGSGKTRLALALAALMRDLPDGAGFVDLAPIRDPRLVVPTIAAKLGLRERKNVAPIDALVAYLGAKELLLLLDNFEQVAAAAPALADLLAACPRLRLLVTSRAPLRLRPESALDVLPLPPPDAVALFLARVRAAGLPVALRREDEEVVAAICRRLDGLPLALELAAPRLALFSPRELLARLEHRLDALPPGGPDRPDRQRTLRATLNWSHDLLEPAERALFRRLAVFVGGCTLEAAGSICADPGGAVAGGLDGLGTLVAHHLLRREDQQGGEPRLGMLETIREFALERLEASGEGERLHRAHAAYYLDLAERAEPAYYGPEAIRWLDRVEGDLDNMRAALSWLLERENPEQEDIELAVRLAGALRSFWLLRGAWREGRRWLEKALAVSTAIRTAGKAKVLGAASVIAMRQGDPTKARKYLRECLAIARELDNKLFVSLTLGDLGVVAFAEGKIGRSAILCRGGLAIAEVEGDLRGVAIMLQNLGYIALRQGDVAGAAALLDRSLATARRSGDQRGILEAAIGRGMVALEQGQDQAAIDWFEEALVLARNLRHREGVAHYLEARAGQAALRGQATLAARLWGAAETALDTIGVNTWPARQWLYAKYQERARSDAEASAFEAAWMEGRALAPEEAVAAARADLQPAATDGY